MWNNNGINSPRGDGNRCQLHWDTDLFAGQSATKEMHAKLESARLPIGAKTYSPNELIGLPGTGSKVLSRRA